MHWEKEVCSSAALIKTITTGKIAEKVCAHIKAYIQNKTLFLKMPLDSSFGKIAITIMVCPAFYSFLFALFPRRNREGGKKKYTQPKLVPSIFAFITLKNSYFL